MRELGTAKETIAEIYSVWENGGVNIKFNINGLYRRCGTGGELVVSDTIFPLTFLPSFPSPFLSFIVCFCHFLPFYQCEGARNLYREWPLKKLPT